MSLCLVGIYTTRLAKTYPTFNQSSVFLIYVFVQYSHSQSLGRGPGPRLEPVTGRSKVATSYLPSVQVYREGPSITLAWKNKNCF